MRVTGRAIGLERIGAGHVLQHGNANLAVDFVHVEVTGRRQGGNVRAQTGRNNRVGRERRALMAMLDTDRDIERARRQVGDGAADVGGIILQMLIALVVLGEADEVQHLLRDRPRAAEQVQRNAGRGAIGDRPDCLCDAVRADVAGEALPGLVDPEGTVEVPIPVMPAHAELAVEGGRRRIGRDLLAEVALAGFDEAAADEGIIGHVLPLANHPD